MYNQSEQRISVVAVQNGFVVGVADEEGKYSKPSMVFTDRSSMLTYVTEQLDLVRTLDEATVPSPFVNPAPLLDTDVPF